MNKEKIYNAIDAAYENEDYKFFNKLFANFVKRTLKGENYAEVIPHDQYDWGQYNDWDPEELNENESYQSIKDAVWILTTDHNGVGNEYGFKTFKEAVEFAEDSLSRVREAKFSEIEEIERLG